jgi:hypothetical protein
MLSGYKTYIVGGLGVLSAIGLYLAGQDTLAQAIQLGITAILGMTVRAAVGAPTQQ